MNVNVAGLRLQRRADISFTSRTIGAASPPNTSRSMVSLLPPPVSRTMARPNSAVTSSSAFWPWSHFLGRFLDGLWRTSTTNSISHCARMPSFCSSSKSSRGWSAATSTLPSALSGTHQAAARRWRIGARALRRYSPAREIVEGSPNLAAVCGFMPTPGDSFTKPPLILSFSAQARLGVLACLAAAPASGFGAGRDAKITRSGYSRVLSPSRIRLRMRPR